MMSSTWCALVICALSICQVAVSKYMHNKIDIRSPLYLRLPDCQNVSAIPRIKPNTKARGVICSTFKNEGGFLSEYLAYYQMHGIEHVRLLDKGSTDEAAIEVEPWLKSGFLSLETDVADHSEGSLKTTPRRDRALFDKQCKVWAQDRGFDYLFSVDIDEYLIPVQDGVSIMDAMHMHVLDFSSSVVEIPRLMFQSSPHTLEPVDLLTIEAFQLRMSNENQLTFLKNVSSKVAVRLNGPSFKQTHRDFVVHCCNAWGCEARRKRCREVSAVSAEMLGVQQPEHAGGGEMPPSPLVIFRYARSLEKFELQYSVNKDSSSVGSSGGQDVGRYMDMSLGVERDSRAASRYGCQLREELRRATGQDVYVRPGPYWYRNVIFGKELKDGRKGKRSGRAIPAGKKVWADDPHVYHGFYKSKLKNAAYTK